MVIAAKEQEQREVKSMRELVFAHHGELQAIDTRRCFDTWLQQVCARKRARAVVARLLQRTTLRGMRDCFTDWAVAVAEEKRQAQMARVLGAMRARTRCVEELGLLRGALELWHAKANVVCSQAMLRAEEAARERATEALRAALEGGRELALSEARAQAQLQRERARFAEQLAQQQQASRVAVTLLRKGDRRR